MSSVENEFHQEKEIIEKMHEENKISEEEKGKLLEALRQSYGYTSEDILKSETNINGKTTKKETENNKKTKSKVNNQKDSLAQLGQIVTNLVDHLI